MPKKENIIEVLINKQFEIAGYDLNEINFQKLIETKDKDWYMRYKTTHEKDNEFREWLRNYVKKKVSKHKIESEVGMFMLAYGLTVE